MLKKEIDYMWEKQIYDPIKEKEINSWSPIAGPVVIERNVDNTAKKVRFQLVIDSPFQNIYLLCNASGWQKNEEFKFSAVDHSNYYILETDKIKHNDIYRLLVNDKELKDPASTYFSKYGDCVFFDLNDPSVYKMKYEKVNLIEKSTRILQTDIIGLIYHWKHKNKEIFGKDVPHENTFKYIKESGIVEFIKELGFNAVQFLPVAQSIDGINWKHRYLVVYHFAVSNTYGTPSEFMEMIDEFHRNEIAVIDDVVLGHMPDRDYQIFGKIGDLHEWYDRHNQQLFMKDHTTWGSRRPNFENPLVRKYLIDSCLFFIKNYRIDGFRIDNVDGILRYGDCGDGPDRPGGRDFLRELTKEIYSYSRYAYISYEAHFFYEDNAKMLVAPLDSNQRALAATAYNESRVTHYLHKDYMLKTAAECTVWKFKYISEEKEWGKSNSTIADFHNHDAAAGLMYGRATGAYAYQCMILKNKSVHKYAVGKIKAMEALISLFMESRTLDLMQTFLLQEGTFEHDTGITWGVVFSNVDAKRLQEYKKDINHLMNEKAFWAINNHTRKYLNIDDNCKILVISRHDDSEYEKENKKEKGDKYIIVLNMSDYEHNGYCIGVEDEGEYECVFNSDERKYAGQGITRYYSLLKTKPTNKFEFFSKELDLGTIAPYECLVLKLKKN
jgi:1,4-alpha-glucan branching enzyme